MKGFDHKKYLQEQSANIRKRIERFGGKLYLEFGGKLFDDFHASRVLPGFEPDSKIKMLMELKDDAEVIVVINADDIERNKRRGDLGITYDLDTLRLIDAFREWGLYVPSVVITRYRGQKAASQFRGKLENLGLRVYLHYEIPGYPVDLERILSEEGFGKNDFVSTERSLVVVTAPGPGSGKMATCLSQIWHENQRGIRAGYAKFETFPIWDLPLRHPVNLAYEAATADLSDVNMLDPFHLEAYGVKAVNYNRDVEIYPVLNTMLKSIWGKSPYASPTDMGVNLIGQCISDDVVCCKAARQEIIRRYYTALCAKRQGMSDGREVDKLKMLMTRCDISLLERPVIATAKARAEESQLPAVAIELPDGTLVTGGTSELLGASSACLMNALKALAGIEKEVQLLSREIIEPIQNLKVSHMGNRNPRLHTDETLIALTICAVNDPNAALALEQLEKLKNCQLHASVILARVDENVFQRLGLHITCEPVYQTNKLYHG